MHPSPCRFLCGLLVYAAAAANMFVLAARHPGFAFAGAAILAVGVLGGTAIRRFPSRATEFKGAEHAAR